jgi:hypothetical protein
VFLAGGLLLWIFLLRDGAAYGVRALGAKGHGYSALLAVGIASAVSQAVEAGAFSGMTVIAGRLGANVVAGYQILLNLMAFVFMIALGMAAATAVLVSEAIGRKAPYDAARAGWTGIGLNEMSMLIAAVAIFVFATPIGHAYTADVQLAALISSLIWICALVLHPDGAQVVTASESILNLTNMGIGGFDCDGREKDFKPSLTRLSADGGFARMFNLTLTDGRWFRQDDPADYKNVVLNETRPIPCASSADRFELIRSAIVRHPHGL